MKIIAWLAPAAAVLATAVAGWSGYSWWQAEHDDGVARAVVREEALQARPTRRRWPMPAPGGPRSSD